MNSLRDQSAPGGAEILLEGEPERNASFPSSAASSFFRTENAGAAYSELPQDHPWFHPPKMQYSLPVPAHNADADAEPFSDFSLPRAGELAYVSGDARRAFFRQAQQYEAQDGIPCDEVPFFHYFPSYSVMGPRQLEWYFYWRSSVRRGIYIQTQASYVFLYFYELIHQIGCPSPENALEQMLFVWREARGTARTFDPYLSVWVRDFILYYSLDRGYYDAVESVLGEEAGLYLPQECIQCFLRGEKRSGFLHALEALSDYPASCGRFYRDGFAPLFDDAVGRIFSLLCERYAAKGNRNLWTVLCGDSPGRLRIRPFESALFYEHGPAGRTGGSVVNSGVSFDFYPRTIESTLIPCLRETRKARRLMTGFLRTVESVLRDLVDYRWSIKRGRLPKAQLVWIEKQTVLFYRDYLERQKRKTIRPFHVDADALLRLKQDSEEIREHLLLRQASENPADWEDSEDITDAGRFPEGEDAALTSWSPKEEEAAAEEKWADLKDFEEDEIFAEPDEHSESYQGRQADSPFFLLLLELSAPQAEIVAVLCNQAHFPDSGVGASSDPSRELYAIAAASNTFPDVIIEQINNLSADRIGDLLIDTGGAVPRLYPDYLDEIKEALSYGGR